MIHPKTNPSSSRGANPAPDCTLVIFGVTGDMTHRLLMLALYNLSRWKLLPARFAIVGVGRSEITVDKLRDDLTKTIQGFVDDKGGEFSADSLDREAWTRVVGRLAYVPGDIGDPKTYQELSQRIKDTGGPRHWRERPLVSRGRSPLQPGGEPSGRGRAHGRGGGWLVAGHNREAVRP